MPQNCELLFAHIQNQLRIRNSPMKLNPNQSDLSSARESLLTSDPIPLLQKTRRSSRNDHLDPLNDQTIKLMLSDPSHFVDQNFNIEQELLAQYHRFPVITPENVLLILWHSVIATIIIYYQIEAGLLLTFGHFVWSEEISYLLWLNILFIFILFFDVLLSPLKAFYKFGFLITSRQKLLKRYLKWKFWMDLLSLICIALPYITRNLNINWLKLYFLIYKLYDLNLLDLEFQRLVQNNLRLHTWYMLSRLMFLLYIGSHFIGIGFYLVDWYIYTFNYYGPNTPNYCWIFGAQAYTEIILTLSWVNQYIYILYFSIGTMTTIAYGDITPLSPFSALYVIFAYIPYTLGFAYIISQVLRIVIEAQAYKFQYTNNLLAISNLMIGRRISSGTRIKAMSYYEESWLQEKFRNRTVQKELISDLPNKLKRKLLITVYEDFLKEIGFIQSKDDIKRIFKNENNSFLLAFASQINEERLAQGLVIYKEGDQFNQTEDNCHSMYFFQRKNHWNSITLGVGKMPIIEKYLLDNSQKSIENIYNGLMKISYANRAFGEKSFFSGQKRNHWAMSNRSCLVYYISRKVYLELKDKEWTSLDRQLLANVEQGSEFIQCYLCHQSGHKFQNCPLSSYHPKIQELLKEADYSVSKYQTKLNKQLIMNIRKKREIQSLKSNSLRNHRNLKNIFMKQNRSTHQKVKKVLLTSKHYELESQSSQDDHSDSEKSEEDLDNYIIETKFLVNKLVRNELKAEETQCYDLDDLDCKKTYKLYKPSSNFDLVVGRYHELILGRQRRNVKKTQILGVANRIKQNEKGKGDNLQTNFQYFRLEQE